MICIKIGDQVPVDRLLLKGDHSLFVRKSTLTGDSDRVEINNDQDPFLFSGLHEKSSVLIPGCGAITEDWC